MPPTPTKPRRRTRRRPARSPASEDQALIPVKPPADAADAADASLTAAVLAAAAAHRFGEIEVPVTIARALEQMGYVTPTEVQARAIPPLRAGHDLIGQAQTGTGKTAAFGIPIVEQVDPGSKAVQALVLTPTREL